MTNNQSLLVILVSSILYFFFAYYTPRTEFYWVFTEYSILFLLFYLLYKYSNISLRKIVIVGVLFRLIFLIATPNLSNDFYRFLWDGRALINGINPYLILPEKNPHLISDGLELYKGMGSMNGSHYTCYPPLNQFAFAISSMGSSSGILVNTILMRIMLIIADIITLYFGIKTLKKLNLPIQKIGLYFINPFVIIELTGNLYFEGMMLAFLSASIYYLLNHKYYLSAILWAAAISVKLIPLLLLPLLYKKLGFKNFIIFTAIVLITNILLFLPFLDSQLFENFSSSLELYFQNFEFNASLYYIVREIGFWVKGYNIIGSFGAVTPFVISSFIFLLSFIRNNKKTKKLFTSMLFGICSYYLLASVVHPWYLILPLFISVFTPYRFTMLWSFTIILSYSAYITYQYHENLWLVALEYLTVVTYACYEYFLMWKNGKINSHAKKNNTKEK